MLFGKENSGHIEIKKTGNSSFSIIGKDIISVKKKY